MWIDWLRKFLIGLGGTMVIAIGISLFTTTTAATTFYYSVTDLGSLYGNSSTPHGINNAGQVVGESLINNGYSHAFLWQKGTMTDLDPTSSESVAYGINNKGQVLGYRYSSTSKGSGTTLWQNGTKSILDDSPEPQFTGINNVEQLVGVRYYLIHGGEIALPILWQNGTTTELDTLSTPTQWYNTNFKSLATSINDAGQIVGASDSSIVMNSGENLHACLWQNGTITDLGTLPGDSESQATSINNAGKVVGWSWNVSNVQHAVLWQNNKIMDLGTLNGNSTQATAINNHGTVVGYSSVHPFVWRNSTMTDLNSLLPSNSGWELATAVGINDRGQIIGQGKFNGQTKAYLLTPIRRTT